uniref:Protein phosphatase 1 regulatory subunit 26 n=1 Tax=Oryzias melastigma TaxID=30732 RepID=A0A3B3C230_ORYME
MYLMNVPPVAATQTEWRRCGPPGGFSLPVCFNDSDTELSTRDTPISDKVQMIIDSLRSTQSSLDMGQDGRTQACVAAVGSYVEKKSKAKSPPENQQTRPPSMNNHVSSDSDSDDSVDRGIEEAILEYLKEKDDHKRKADTTFLPPSKIPRQHPPILGIFKHNSDSHLPLISCNQIPRMIKTETLTTPTTIPLKKYLKNKASLDENFNLDKKPSTNLASTNEPIQTASNPTSISNKATNTSVTFKIEDDTTDSSSDDGIEEAIQKYQLEKKEQQSQRETFTTPSFKEESDSTSDDGIEEAIRTSSESKLKLKKKHSRADKQARPFSSDSFLGMNSCSPTKSSEQPPLSNTGPLQESEDSSIDSEDGIEQEIRKFLEQKAQMHKQPPGSQHAVIEAEKLGATEVQKKPQRLSLTQRRKQKVLQKMAGTDVNKKSLLEDMQESDELPCRGAAQAIAALQKMDRGGDKSSSLDSDEDLDTAIKDLLKTKKKSKKKIRDLKRKPRKGIKDEELSSGNLLPTKKLKSEPFSRCSTLPKAHKQKDEIKDKLGLIKKNVSQQKHTDQSKTETQKDFLHIVKAPPQEKDDSSSVDSDDSIEQEIRKFLAEKAKVSTTEKAKDGDVSRNGTVIVQGVGIKQESQLAEVSTKSPPLGSISFPVPDTKPQRLQSVISPTSAQPRALQPCSPSLLEPADGAGAARVEQGRANATKQDALDAGKTAGRGRPVLSPNLSHSSAEANKWRQSLGLPLFDTKAVSRTPFLINTSEIKGTPGSTFSNQNKSPKLQTSAGSWFASKTGRAPPSCSKETEANPTVRPPVLNFYSAARQHPTMSFAHGLLPGHSSQFSVGEEKASTVHVPKDKSVFVELETNRTNHVQVQSRERREANERAQMLNDRKAEGKKIDVSADRRQEEEEFIDETDCESDGRTDPGKKQGFSAL